MQSEVCKKAYTVKDVKRIAEKTKLVSEIDKSLPAEVKDAVAKIISAREKVRGKHTAVINGKESRYITERLRTAYIGEECYTIDGVKYLATNRGKPTGTIIAAFDKDKQEILYGVALISEDEKFQIPIIGLATALENIKPENEIKIGMNGHEKRQFDRFKLRAMAYFMPEKYSFSKGTEPVKYPNYDEIHMRQMMLKGAKGGKSNKKTNKNPRKRKQA